MLKTMERHKYLRGNFEICSKLTNLSINSRCQFSYRWSSLVAVVCLYNVIVVPMMIFEEFYINYYMVWLIVNALTDLINIIDIYIQMKKVRVEQGLVTSQENFDAYIKSYCFVFDVISVLPTDFGFIFYPRNSILRLNRILKFYRVSEFVEQTEIRTNHPYIVRLFRLSVICFIIFHWNCCIYFFLSIIYNFEEAKIDDWIFSYAKIPDLRYALCDARYTDTNFCMLNETNRNARKRDRYIEELVTHWKGRINTTHFPNWAKKYQQSFYWSALTLVTLGEQPWPNNSFQSVFEFCDTLLGLLIFAVIIGDVGSMVTQMNFNKTRYEEFIDNCKRYMNFRKVHGLLQTHIINWLDYYWMESNAGHDESKIYEFLPRCLRKDLAAEIHLESLRNVPLFKDCEEELLHEIIHNFRLQIYSPGDFICHKGDIGKEVYVIKRGELEVLDEETNQIFARLCEGAVFGELSVLNITANKNGNRRTASIRAVGFVDLYVLQKRDLWISIHDHPTAKKRLTDKGKEILGRENLLIDKKDSNNDLDSEEEEVDYGMTDEERFAKLWRKIQKLTDFSDKFEQKFIVCQFFH